MIFTTQINAAYGTYVLQAKGILQGNYNEIHFLIFLKKCQDIQWLQIHRATMVFLK